MLLFIILIILIVLYLYRDQKLKEKYIQYVPCRDKTQKNILSYDVVLKPTKDIEENNLSIHINQPSCSGLQTCSLDESRESCPSSTRYVDPNNLPSYNGGNSTTYCPTCPLKRSKDAVYPIPGFEMV